MEIDIAEIRLVGDGFTSKELDPTTSLYYGVYPARRVRQTRRSLATEGRSARYYSAWAVEDPALRGSRWMSVDPLAKKYPGWSPYDYVRDNPAGLVDPNGAQVKPKQYYKESTNLTLPPLTLADHSESNPASISANGFASSPSDATGASLLGNPESSSSGGITGAQLDSFAYSTATTGADAYFAVGALAYVGSALTMVEAPEIGVPLGRLGTAAIGLGLKSEAVATAVTAVQALQHEKPPIAFYAQLGGTTLDFVGAKFIEAIPAGTATRAAGEILNNQSSELFKQLIMDTNPASSH